MSPCNTSTNSYIAPFGKPLAFDRIKSLKTSTLVELCLDRTQWQKDLLTSPAPPPRAALKHNSYFREVVFLNHRTFLFLPRPGKGHVKTVKPDSNGDLRGIGSLPDLEYRTLFRETWIHFAMLVLTEVNLGKKKKRTSGPRRNPDSIIWVPGHWRKLPDTWNAYKIAPWKEDRREYGYTWVDQFKKGEKKMTE